MKLRAVIFFLFIVFSWSIRAQVNANDSVVAAFIPSFSYAFQFPGGDVADQYGNNSTIGGSLMYKTRKNILLSFDVNFIFGSDIKNDDSILKMVMTDNGYIIDGNGVYALYSMYERGYSVNFRIGKILRLLSVNPNSGVMLTGGVGFLLHRMKLDVQHETAPQISGDYGKGYDRLTSGFALNEFVGYFFMGKSRILNFYAGFEFYQAFTKSRRDYIFDLMRKDDSNHHDFFYGIKIGWMIPVYDRAPDKYYYY
jgi:hypothetical protein